MFGLFNLGSILYGKFMLFKLFFFCSIITINVLAYVTYVSSYLWDIYAIKKNKKGERMEFLLKNYIRSVSIFLAIRLQY